MPSKPFLVADTGAMLIFGEWVPDPEVEANKLLQLANAVGDWSEPMIASRAAIIYDTEQHFAEETDPWGEPWAELEDNYREQKVTEGFPDEILVRTGDLKDAATDESAYMLTEREILFNESVLPFYGVYHQALERGKAPFPRRAFVGISEECENEIEAIFVDWINRTTDVVYPPTKPVIPGNVEMANYGARAGVSGIVTKVAAFGGGVMLRGPGGRFVGATR